MIDADMKLYYFHFICYDLVDANAQIYDHAYALISIFVRYLCHLQRNKFLLDSLEYIYYLSYMIDEMINNGDVDISYVRFFY